MKKVLVKRLDKPQYSGRMPPLLGGLAFVSGDPPSTDTRSTKTQDRTGQ